MYVLSIISMFVRKDGQWLANTGGSQCLCDNLTAYKKLWKTKIESVQKNYWIIVILILLFIIFFTLLYQPSIQTVIIYILFNLVKSCLAWCHDIEQCVEITVVIAQTLIRTFTQELNLDTMNYIDVCANRQSTVGKYRGSLCLCDNPRCL